MKSVMFAVVCLLGTAAFGAESLKPITRTGQEQATQRLAFYERELQFIELLQQLGDDAPPIDAILENVRIVDPRSGIFHDGQSVIIHDGRIASITEDPSAFSDDYVRIDGQGQFLAPGLADMHVHHTVSASQHLLHTLHGVTTVREMVGFPWLLDWRCMSRRDTWAAPNIIVAGHIIASRPMGMFATVVRSEDEARQVVRQHASLGYDAIKVHNLLALPLFDAVAEEARLVGLPLVGHIPHDVSVGHALAMGMSTIEHLKGYLLDRTLTISEEDWATATRHSLSWHTPTLYTSRLAMSRSDAEQWLLSDEAKFVPATLRSQWMATGIPDPDERLTQMMRDQTQYCRQIIQGLIPVTNRFLVGSDSGGGYAFMVPGYATFEEMRLLHEAGLSVPAILRAATTSAAQAARQEASFGDVRIGARADLVLLKTNPLLSIPSPRDVEAVMIRGRWIGPELRRVYLERLATLCNEDARPRDGQQNERTESLVTRMSDARQRGYLFPAHHLQEIANLLSSLGDETRARVVRSWQDH